MKKIFLLLFITGFSIAIFAQRDSSEEKTGGFQKDKFCSEIQFQAGTTQTGFLVSLSRTRLISDVVVSLGEKICTQNVYLDSLAVFRVISKT